MTGNASTKVANAVTPVFLLIALVLIYLAFSNLDVDIKPILAIIISLTPIWMPYVLFYIVYDQWMWFVRERWKHKQGRVTLRIKLPQEVLKSPEAMESVFTHMHNVSKCKNLYEAYWLGKHPLIYSYELVSIGGDVRFYANVPVKKGKNFLETQLYAQYPGIEIVEEPIDYTNEVQWDPEKWEMISFHVGKRGDSDVLPIKTYIDMGLDKMPKEEEKFEPMSPLLEFLGRAKAHERVWIQILTLAHQDRHFRNGHIPAKASWQQAAKDKVNEMMKRDSNGKPLTEDESELRPVLTPTERTTVEAIERNVSKTAYEFAIRMMYITKKGKFDGDMISPMFGSFGEYEMGHRNNIGIQWRTDFDNNFLSDISGRRVLNFKKDELEHYKKRFYLHRDNKAGFDKMRVISVEELATIFHIPGSSVITPTLSRVETTRKEAPANLPIQLPTE